MSKNFWKHSAKCIWVSPPTPKTLCIATFREFNQNHPLFLKWNKLQANCSPSARKGAMPGRPIEKIQGDIIARGLFGVLYFLFKKQGVFPGCENYNIATGKGHFKVEGTCITHNDDRRLV